MVLKAGRAEPVGALSAVEGLAVLTEDGLAGFGSSFLSVHKNSLNYIKVLLLISHL